MTFFSTITTFIENVDNCFEKRVKNYEVSHHEIKNYQRFEEYS